MENYNIILSDLTNHSPLSVLANAQFADYWKDMQQNADCDCVELIKLYGDTKNSYIVMGVDTYTINPDGTVSNTDHDTMRLYIEAWALSAADEAEEDAPIACQWVGQPDKVTEEDILFAFLSVFSRAKEYLASEDNN